jgi:ferrochelatase
MATTTGLLLLAYGSPDTERELECYLHDVRGGRPPSPELLAEMRHRYAAIGGRSPLLPHTRAQAAATAAELAQRGTELPVAIGMRHWDPRIQAGLAELRAAGVTRVIALILAPHACHATLAAYRKVTEAALATLAWAPELRWVEAWSHLPALLAAQANLLRQALAEVPPGARCRVVFTAHSLPARILASGDPYADDLRANAAAVAAAVGVADWSFAYQSAGAAGGPWLGPDLITEVLPALQGEGYEHLVVQPIGFVCDHLEVLYDLDHDARNRAAALGLGFTRVASLNTAAGFIAAIADAVAPHLA